VKELTPAEQAKQFLWGQSPSQSDQQKPAMTPIPDGFFESVNQKKQTPKWWETAREVGADVASHTSRVAGQISAVATATAVIAPNSLSADIAIGMAAVSLGADALEQALRPNLGKTIVDIDAQIIQGIIDKRVPLLAPVTNELMNAWTHSQDAQKLGSTLNQDANNMLNRP
jgi:filamentous hemagglutinin